MSNYDAPPPPDKDPQLWRMAQKRASFKAHLSTYIVINGFLWLLWLFTGSDTNKSGIPWPVWSTAGWGVGLFFHFIGAYADNGSSVEKEYNKLKKQQNQF